MLLFGSKRILLKKIFILMPIYLIAFLVGDIIFSNFFYLKAVKYGCIKKYEYFYELEKNCIAYEKLIGSVSPYKVFTDSKGYRYSGNKTKKGLPIIIKILDKKNLLAINQLLDNIEVDFSVVDFEAALKLCTKNDFCYLDPPYQPEQEGGFTSYTKSAFNEENQKRLCDVIKALTENKTNVMLSSSETKLIRELYSKYNIEELPTLRAINSDATNRKGSTELVITNY